MLALLTLSKLIKLEFAALDWLTTVKRCFFKSWDKFYCDLHAYCLHRAHACYWGCLSTLPAFDQYTSHVCDETFTLDLPVVPSPNNPNRFIRSSWILSLVWAAKFYRSIANRYQTYIRFASARDCSHPIIFALKTALDESAEQQGLMTIAPNTAKYILWN